MDKLSLHHFLWLLKQTFLIKNLNQLVIEVFNMFSNKNILWSFPSRSQHEYYT